MPIITREYAYAPQTVEPLKDNTLYIEFWPHLYSTPTISNYIAKNVLTTEE